MKVYKVFQLPILILIFLTISCSDEGNLHDIEQQLIKQIDNRIELLSNNYRHQLLADYNLSISYEQITTVFTETESGKVKVNTINGKLKELSDLTGLELEPVKNNDEKVKLLLNKEILLDDLLIKTRSQLNVFNSVSPRVYKKYEDQEAVIYHIVPVAIDSLFNPEVELIVNDKTFPILIQNGVGEFRMRKKEPSSKHSLKGNLLIYDADGDKQKIPFDY